MHRLRFGNILRLGCALSAFLIIHVRYAPAFYCKNRLNALFPLLHDINIARIIARQCGQTFFFE